MSPDHGPLEPSRPLPPELQGAGEDWRQRGRSQKLLRWLERFLNDPEQIPRFGEPSDWWTVLDALLEWRDLGQGGWPDPLDDLTAALLKNALRFSRTDGSAVFRPEGQPAERAERVRRWVDRLDDPALRTIARWWFPTRGKSARRPQDSSPPLPAVSSERRVLAMLRPDWLAQGDFLAVHQPSGAPATSIELRGRGCWLLGPDWLFRDPSGLSSSPRRAFWSTLSRADVLEWSLRSGSSRVARTAARFRGAQMALLSEQLVPVSPRTRVTLPVAPAVSASLAPDGSFGLLKAPGLKAQVIPLAVSPDDPGSAPPRLSLDEGRFVLEFPSPGKRAWVGWLVVWDPARARRTPAIRPLTVTTRTIRCRPDQAQAFRIGWGAGLDGLVVYRSLARPDLRTFLGQQTADRFRVGWFDTSGNLKPLLNIPS